jgi:nickel-dependent lactate racemase
MIFSFAPGRPIAEREFREKLSEALAKLDARAKWVLAIIPDNTRTLPMPAAFETIAEACVPRARTLSFLIALGTHPPLTEDELARHLGPRFHDFPSVQILQHRWDDQAALARVGTITREEMEEISGGLLQEDVPVHINRMVLEHDLLLLLGPVFPHEVVGFSGGHKYLFPGIAGPEILHASHWLGALITNPKVNGHRDTPVRALIERAATLIPTPRVGISLVMRGHDLIGLFVGEVKEAWAAAAALSAEVNIVWADRAYSTVISMAPRMYRELWTAGKCMYKLEPVVEDGGTLIIYGPHIREVSVTHGKWLFEIGYHTRDYFLAQWDKYKHIPWAVLAHSTHVKGIGTYRNGVERPRIEVVLATGLPEKVCRRINLGYRDPASTRPEEFLGREKEGILVVPNAGEVLWRLSNGTFPDIDRL